LTGEKKKSEKVNEKGGKKVKTENGTVNRK
jgi:hypothetical protein